jgi:hypothetical protein
MTRHDSTVIGAGPAQDWLMLAALGAHDRLVGRTRDILNHNYPIIASWLTAEPRLSFRAPDAGAITFAKVNHPLPTIDLATKILEATDVLLVPGDHFGMPGWLRIGYGGRPEDLSRGLELVGAWLEGA